MIDGWVFASLFILFYFIFLMFGFSFLQVGGFHFINDVRDQSPSLTSSRFSKRIVGLCG